MATRSDPLGALALIALLACRDPTGSDSDAGGDTSSDTSGDTARDSGTDPGPQVTLEAEENPYNPLSAFVTVTADRDVTLQLEHGEDGSFGHPTPAQELAANESAQVLVLGLRASREHWIRALGSIDGRTWTSQAIPFETQALPADWPSCHVTHHGSAEPGEDEVICSNADVKDGAIYFCLDGQGEIVWAIPHPAGEGIHAFRVLQDGSFAMTSDTQSMLAFSAASGEPLASYTPGWFLGATRFEHHWIDIHEVIQLTEGPWAGAVAFLTQSFEEPDPKTLIKGAGIVVMDPSTGDVHWDWSATGKNLSDGLSIDEDLSMDRVGLYIGHGGWLHANALLHRLEEGRQIFWMHMRHQDWMIKIDVETDDVVWRLGYEGDFALVDDLDADTPQAADDWDWFYQGHAPEQLSFEDGRTRFVMLDNGVIRPGIEDYEEHPYSRVVEYLIDESSMRAQLLFSYGSADESSPDWFYSSPSGDADLTEEGDRLHFVKSDPPAFIGEVSYPEGELLRKIECDVDTEHYRVNWAPSLYELDWRFEGE